MDKSEYKNVWKEKKIAKLISQKKLLYKLVHEHEDK